MNILRASKQQWKLNTLIIGVVFGGVLMSFGTAIGNFGGISRPELLEIFGTLLVVASFAFACLAIKCRVCKDKWFWRAVSTRHSGEWLFWLFAQESCPRCGYSGDDAA